MKNPLEGAELPPDSAGYDVIIAGAGPVGLFLACELALARCSVLVLEKAAQPSGLTHQKSWTSFLAREGIFGSKARLLQLVVKRHQMPQKHLFNFDA